MLARLLFARWFLLLCSKSGFDFLLIPSAHRVSESHLRQLWNVDSYTTIQSYYLWLVCCSSLCCFFIWRLTLCRYLTQLFVGSLWFLVGHFSTNHRNLCFLFWRSQQTFTGSCLLCHAVLLILQTETIKSLSEKTFNIYRVMLLAEHSFNTKVQNV